LTWIALLLCKGTAAMIADHKPVVPDSIVVIVNINNQIDKLSTAQVKSYFLKRTKFWKSGEKVVFFDLRQSSTIKTLFVKEVIKVSISRIERYWLERKQRDGIYPPQQVGSQRLAIALVSRKTNAISYVYKNSLSTEDFQKVRIVYATPLP